MAKAVVILGFCLSFAAGLVIGWRTHKLESPLAAITTGGTGKHATTQAGARRGSVSWWQTELGLSADQRTKLDKIWSPMASKARTDHEDRRREYRRERDSAIADLVPASQLGEYDKIIDAYNERITSLDRESREAYDAAVEQTRQILNADQQTRYEDLLKRYHWNVPGAPRERHPSTRRTETRPTTDATAVPLSNASSPSSPASPSLTSSTSSTSNP